MNNARINNEINLTYPDGYMEMGEEDLKKYFTVSEKRWGVYNADAHSLLSVSWTKGGFLGFLTDTESVLIGIESCLRRNLLNYQRVDSYKIKVASKNKKPNARGIRFEYRVNDAALVQAGDIVVFKHKKLYYVFYFITRKNNAIEQLPTFRDILESVTVD